VSVAAPAAAPRRIGGVLMEIRHITLRFGGVTAIRDISFDVREGEFRAIIGPNGAGKSSMLNAVNGFYHPQEGPGGTAEPARSCWIVVPCDASEANGQGLGRMR
jgi:ABC-type uncharacterized transport system ATPase subunit